MKTLPFWLLASVGSASVVQRDSCAVVNSFITRAGVQKQATAFCASYLHIPVSSTTSTVVKATAVVTAVPNTEVSVSMTTSTTTAYATVYALSDGFLCADAVRVQARQDERSEIAVEDIESALERRATPPGLFRGYSPRQISSACSCLSLSPSTTTILATSISTSFSTMTTGDPSTSVTTITTATTSTVTAVNAAPTFDVYKRSSDGQYAGLSIYQNFYTFRSSVVNPHFRFDLACNLDDHAAGDETVFGGPGIEILPYTNPPPIGFVPIKCRISPVPYVDPAGTANQDPDSVYFPMTCSVNGNLQYSSSYDCNDAHYWKLYGTTAPSGCQTDALQMLAVFTKSSFTPVTS